MKSFSVKTDGLQSTNDILKASFKTVPISKKENLFVVTAENADQIKRIKGVKSVEKIVLN